MLASSPYLNLPLRSLDDVLRARAVRSVAEINAASIASPAPVEPTARALPIP